MKKLLLFLMAIILATPAFASVGVRLNGAIVGTATDLNFTCGSGTLTSLTSDGGIYNINCSPNLSEAGFANAGYVSLASTTAAISPSYSFIRKVLDSDGNAAFTAGTLANGIPGEILTIYAAGITPSGATTGGNFTLTPTTTTGFKSVELSAIGDVVTLNYINDTFGWIIMGYTPAASNSITITLKA